MKKIVQIYSALAGDGSLRTIAVDEDGKAFLLGYWDSKNLSWKLIKDN